MRYAPKGLFLRGNASAGRGHLLFQTGKGWLLRTNINAHTVTVLKFTPYTRVCLCWLGRLFLLPAMAISAAGTLVGMGVQ